MKLFAVIAIASIALGTFGPEVAASRFRRNQRNFSGRPEARVARQLEVRVKRRQETHASRHDAILALENQVEVVVTVAKTDQQTTIRTYNKQGFRPASGGQPQSVMSGDAQLLPLSDRLGVPLFAAVSYLDGEVHFQLRLGSDETSGVGDTVRILGEEEQGLSAQLVTGRGHAGFRVTGGESSLRATAESGLEGSVRLSSSSKAPDLRKGDSPRRSRK